MRLAGADFAAKEFFYPAWEVKEKCKLTKAKADADYDGIVELICVARRFSLPFEYSTGAQTKRTTIEVQVGIVGSRKTSHLVNQMASARWRWRRRRW